LKKLEKFFKSGQSSTYPGSRLLVSLKKQLKAVKEDYREEEYAVAFGRIEAVGEILSDVEEFYRG